MVDVTQLRIAFGKAIPYSLRWEARPMLDAPKALLFGSCHNHAVNYETCRSVTMVGV